MQLAWLGRAIRRIIAASVIGSIWYKGDMRDMLARCVARDGTEWLVGHPNSGPRGGWANLIRPPNSIRCRCPPLSVSMQMPDTEDKDGDGDNARGFHGQAVLSQSIHSGKTSSVLTSSSSTITTGFFFWRWSYYHCSEISKGIPSAASSTALPFQFLDIVICRLLVECKVIMFVDARFTDVIWNDRT